MNEIRWDLIAHIKEQIEVGTFVTEGKLWVVSEKIAERLERQPEHGERELKGGRSLT